MDRRPGGHLVIVNDECLTSWERVVVCIGWNRTRRTETSGFRRANIEGARKIEHQVDPTVMGVKLARKADG